ncbi:carbonic anhydrase/acetyltransferase-like protein (isoleucine patch superfamily) [Streptomyces sp. V4I8]|uniref:gamma carbonic anhydrase family protein n=1 Tax=Streptomyces sp. V4I8 TaxID=3156469 RepID=UPI0035146106
MPVYALGSAAPEIHPDAFVHPDAVIVGRVTLRAKANVWPCATLRGDYGEIVIGEQTSVQDGCVLHADLDAATVIGARCVLGHLAHLEGCRVGDGTLIGAGAVVLKGAEVGAGAMVGAGALLTPGTVVPARARALGVPARVEPDHMPENAFADGVALYVRNAERYRWELRRID